MNKLSLRKGFIQQYLIRTQSFRAHIKTLSATSKGFLVWHRSPFPEIDASQTKKVAQLIGSAWRFGCSNSGNSSNFSKKLRDLPSPQETTFSPPSLQKKSQFSLPASSLPDQLKLNTDELHTLINDYNFCKW